MKHNKDLAKEVSNFVSFLDGLRSFSLPVKREQEPPSCESPSIYKNKIADLALVFIGDSDVIRGTYYGYEPYVGFIERLTKRGISTYYLLARGKMNILVADATAKIVQNRNSLRITDRYVDSVQIGKRTIDTICIRMEKK